MAYNQNIPQPADQLKNSQPQLLANFQEINTLINVNHVGFNVGDQGKHTFLQMPQQVAAPATTNTEIGMVCLQGAVSNLPELNFVRDSSGANIPFTEGNLATPGWTILPCGLVVKWGSAVLPASGGAAQSIAWNFVFPVAGNRAFTQPPFLVMLTPSRADLGKLAVGPFWDSANTTALMLHGYTDNLNTGIFVGPIPQYTIQYIAIGI